MLSDRLWKIIRCPMYTGSLDRKGNTLICQDCQTSYAASDQQLDLRLPRPKSVMLPIEVGRPRPRPPLRPIPVNPTSGERPIPNTGNLNFGTTAFTPALYSWFPVLGPDATMLDLGCGCMDRRFEQACQVTGATYIGLDIGDPAPDVLGCGEALPFAAESFDFVLSMGVLSHTHPPSLATQEISRVLRPGSLFIGTAQFMEPCIMASRNHASAIGIVDWLDDAGLEILYLEPNYHYDGLSALLALGYFPPIYTTHAGTLTSLLKPIQALHRWLWQIKPPKSRQVDGKIPYGEGPEAFTASFRFITRKPVQALIWVLALLTQFDNQSLTRLTETMEEYFRDQSNYSFVSTSVIKS